jgi:hypothetical protein
MNKVKIMPNKNGQLVTMSVKNPEWGTVRIGSIEETIDDVTGFTQEKKKSFLMKLKGQEAIDAFLEKHKDGLPGQLIIVEAVESELPAEFEKLVNEKIDREEAIKPYLKKSGKDGVQLTLKGERIFRYTKYDRTGKLFDTLVMHDNREEVKQARELAENGSAEFAK